MALPERQEDMKRVFLLEHLNGWTVGLALLARALGWRVFYSRIAPGWLRHEPRLQRLGLEPQDFEKAPPPVPAGEIHYDPDYQAGVAFQSVFPDPGFFEECGRLFPGVSEAGHKLRVIVSQPAEQDYYRIIPLLRFAQAMQPGAACVRAWFAPSPFIDAYLEPVGGKNLFPAGLLSLQYGLKALRAVWARLRRPRPTTASPINSHPAPSCEVLCFPHQSPIYGRNLFVKDHFYSEDPGSPLHPSRVLHLESHSLHLTPQVRQAYQQLGIPCAVFPDLSPHLMLQAVLRFWRGRPRGRTRSRTFSLAYFLVAFLNFTRYHHGLGQFAGARLALVGYEIVFPKTLALALEARGIPSVAMQERFSHTFCKTTCTYIVHTYLSASPFAQNWLKRRGDVTSSREIPVGMVRTDLLYEFSSAPPAPIQEARRRGRRVVLALDYHTDPDRTVGRLCPVTNWRNNKAFLQDLVTLARRFPDLHFIVRGKTDDWTQLDYFQDVLREIVAQENLEVSRDYCETAMQYRLAATCDLVLAKPTSLGDEAMAFGKPVLFYDYTPTAREIFKCLFDYQGAGIFVQDYTDLVGALEAFVQGRLPSVDRQALYGGLADGRVRGRIQGVLREMLNPSPAPPAIPR